MSTDASIHQLRRKAYLAYHRDGIIDILIGVTILGFGLWLSLNMPIFAFACLLAFSSYVPLKNAITVPRFGFVRFSEEKPESIIVLGIGIGICLLGLAFTILVLLGPDQIGLSPVGFIRKHHPFVMSSIGAVVVTIIGLWRGIHRLVGYGLFLLVTVWLSFWLGLAGSLPLLVVGSAVLIIGVVQLGLFIGKQPNGVSEGNHAP